MNPIAKFKPILLAEDDPLDAELTLRTLRSLSLFNNIIHVTDGQAVIDYLNGTGDYEGKTTEIPALIILDLKMPKVSGIDVVKLLKSDPRKKHIPLVMLTSSQELRDVVDSYGAGLNSYVVKPVDMHQFQQVITSLGLYWAVVNKPVDLD
ncbi:response regulator [soil metagenome]